MKTFGKAIRERRKALGLTQRQLAARVRFEDGHPLSEPYLNDIEHDLRRPPRDHIVAQLARALEVDPVVLFFFAGRLPREISEQETSHAAIEAAFAAFRRVLCEGSGAALAAAGSAAIERRNGGARALGGANEPA